MKRPELLEIERRMESIRWRATRAAFLRESARSLFFACLAGVVVALLAPGLGWLPLVLGVLLVSLMSGAVLALFQHPTGLEAAKACDLGSDLQDRLSSALDLGRNEQPTGMVKALFEDSRQAVQRVEPTRVYPYRLTSTGRWSVLPAAGLVLAVLIPASGSADSSSNAALMDLLADETSALDELLARKTEEPLSPERERLMERLLELQETMAQEGVEKRDVLAEVAELMEELEKQQVEADQQEKELEELAKKLNAGEKNEQLAEEMNNGEYGEAAARVAEMLDELKERLRKMKEEGADPEEIADLEEQIEELEDLQARLLKLRNIRNDASSKMEVLEFLSGLEGELGDIPDDDIIDGKFMKLGELKGDGL